MASRPLDLRAGFPPSEANQHGPLGLSLSEETDRHHALLPHLVAWWAATNPNHNAVVAGNQVMTYSALEKRANQLAHCLRSIGVGPDTRVAICLPRSMALVVASLGVLKAGGGYVPIDPEYPEQRIAWMLNNAQPAVLITEGCVARQFPAGKWRVLNLDSDRRQITAHPAGPLECTASPEDLAYVIYTSGSTGRPKGVEIAHKNLLNLVFWHQQAFEVKPADRASQLASPGFDAAVWELWPYLAAGASLHLAADDIRSDAEAVRDWIVSSGITISFVPTPLAECMLRLPWPRETALRVLLTGADTLRTYPSPGLPFTLVNNYGPTECAVVATSGPVPPNGSCGVLPTIGRPISNVQIYILDENLQRVPDGARGEIYIGGAGVGRGYLNAPDLTAARFISNPLNGTLNDRLYRTGDIGCYLPDGQIAFVGRADDQIKVRGYRIEPNEIMAALAAHDMVQASFVTAQEEPSGEKRLIAYIVAKTGTRPARQELRDFLQRQLPEYMVPASFVQIDSLPVNASGKVDRAALPRPDDSNSLRLDAYVVPRTPIEQRIAEIVGPLVGVERVGMDDNFFLLGGHSLLGTQLIARTRDAFGVDLSLRALFASPTVAALAAEVERLLYVRLEAMTEEEAAQFLAAQREMRPGGLIGN